MTTFWNKVASVAVAGALLVGTGATVLAESPAAAAQSAPAAQAAQAQKAHVSPEAKAKLESLRNLRDQIKDLHAKIVEQRDALTSKLATIKSMIADLKKDPKQNQKQLAIARADLRELKLVMGDIKQVNGQLKTALESLKADIKAKDYDKAAADARQALSLMQTKLDLLRTANNKADQTIAHLKAADHH